MKTKLPRDNAQLIATRKELFKVLLKEHFFKICITSIYTFCFAVPLFGWLIFINSSGMMELTSENYFGNTLFTIVPMFFGILLFGIGVIGGLSYTKKLSLQEGANVHMEFFSGIKKNFKQALISFFVLGLFYCLLKLASNTLMFGVDIPAWSKGVINGLMYVIFFIVFMINALVITQSIIYVGTQRQYVSNAIKLLIGKGPLNLLIFFIVLLPFLCFEFIPFALAQWISIAVSAIFYFGFSFLIFSIYSNYLFDLSINRNYPELYRKGLRKD